MLKNACEIVTHPKFLVPKPKNCSHPAWTLAKLLRSSTYPRQQHVRSSQFRPAKMTTLARRTGVQLAPSLLPMLSRLSTKPFLHWPLTSETRFSSLLLQIEDYWRDRISKQTVGTPKHNAEKKYVLSMFPYPSGMLHMGHMRVYSISDVLSRYYKLNGYNVIHPIGWDAFGLPAENAAMERGIDPKEWTYANAAAMKHQLLRTGVQFDWDREIYTCDPAYYKWTQWIFLKLYEQDLIHRTVAEVNWDPIDKTVLAEEQIDGNGCSWRSGAKAEKRKLAQWMIETPKFAKRLADGLAVLRSDWKDVADIQANWIGKCDVWRFVLRLKDGSAERDFERFDLRIKDPKELANAQFIVVSRDHALVRELKSVPKETTVLSPTVHNFINGKQMPIVVLNEELVEKEEESGTEYFLKARLGNDSDTDAMALLKLKPAAQKLDISMEEIVRLAQKNNCAGYQTSRTLTDWVVSRQRAWGTPIPMALSRRGEAFPVEEQFLPVLTEHRGTEFHSLGKVGHIEKDTLDTFFDSAWYYLRFLDPKNDTAFVDKKITEKFMPVDIYVGGVEHAAVHMFFARFVNYFLYDMGLVAHEEPFHRLVPQGIVRGRTFIDPATGRYVIGKDVEQSGDSFVTAKTGAILESSFEKMSKSKHNGVDPLQVIQQDSADMARLQLLDAASPRANLDWGVSDLKGLRLWIDRIAWVVSTYVTERKDVLAKGGKLEPVPDEIENMYKENYNFFVRNVSMLLEVLRTHNTAIARLQGLTNSLRKIEHGYAGRSREFERCVHALVIMLQVFAPNSASEFWAGLSQVEAINKDLYDHNADVFKQCWPVIDKDGHVDCIVTCFGISCGRIPVKRDMIESKSDAELLELAKSQIHPLFFDQLAKRDHAIDNVIITRRNGLHATIELNMAQSMTEDDLRGVLDAVAKMRPKKGNASKTKTKKVSSNSSKR